MNELPLSEDTFGNPGRIREYKILGYIGLGMLAFGGPLLFFEEPYMILGVILAFIGLMCAVSGWMGVAEEKKKYGVKRKSTPAGLAALFLGIGSVFLSSGPYISIVLGAVAIICAVIAVKKGDNEYGAAGGISGAIGIIINTYVMILLGFIIYQ